MSQELTSVSLSLVAGGASGSVNIATGFPFDTVKVRLQTTCGYKGAWDCASSIWKTEGIRAFYRGLSAPLIGGAAETAINYAVYVHMLKSLRANSAVPDGAVIPLAAGSAGFVLSFVLSPAELIKCRMQQGSSAGVNYRGPVHCLKHVIETEGFQGLGRGTSGTLAREIPGNALFFTLYEALRQRFPGRPPSKESHPGFLGVLKDATSAICCGGIAGMVMWTAVLPIDVAKSRMQVASPGSRYDVSVLKNIRLLYAEGGRRAMYAGLLPTLFRAFPSNAAQWLTWELALRAAAASE